MEEQTSVSAWHRKFPPFGKLDWMINRGMLGWGTGTALLLMLLQLYQGRTLTFKDAAVQTVIYVFVGGPAWGYFMWRYFSSKQSRQAKGDGAVTAVEKAPDEAYR